MKIKTARDKRDHRYDRVSCAIFRHKVNISLTCSRRPGQNLYVLSELSIHLIKMFGRRHNWPIPTYPGQLMLPADLFEVIQDVDARKKVLNRVYLDEAVLEKVDVGPEKKRVVVTGRKRAAANGHADGDVKPKKRVKTSTSSAPKRKAGTTKGKGKAQKKKQVDKWDSDAEDESEEASASEEEDDDDDDASGAGKDSDAEIVARLTPGSAKKATAATRGQRGGLRSDQDKKLQSGLGQDESDDDSDKMDVDEPAAVDSPSKAVKAKPKANGAPQKKKTAAASPAAAKGHKGKATKAKATETKARPARKGLAGPRKLKAGADLDEISDVGDSDDGKENDSD